MESENANNNNNDNTKITINNDSTIVIDEKKQPSVQLGRVELLLVVFGLSLSMFLAALDQTIVATTLPAIASEFQALDKISWVATAFFLTSTAFQPTYGKLSDIFGRKATFLFAITVFELGSLLCGLSPNMTSLIVSRAIAGVGGGGIVSLVTVIVSDIVSLQDRGKYQGLIASVFGIASVVGPLLGGIFIDHATWRWAFYINLPLGVIAIGTIVFVLRIPRPNGSLSQKIKRIDYAGTFVVVGATITLLLPMNWGGNEYPWDSPIIIGLLIAGCIGFGLFFLIETKFAVEPIAPPYLFKRLNLVGCFVTTFFQGMAFFSLIYYIPLYFQVVKGDTATASGLELIPYVLGVVLSLIVIGQFVSRTDIFSYRTISAMSAISVTIGVGLMTTWDENTGRAPQICYMIIAGVGVGSIVQTTVLCVQGIVEQKDIATATGVLVFSRLMGAVFGVAIFGTIFSNFLTVNLERIAMPLELINAVKQSATLVKFLPKGIRQQVITAYVNSLKAGFTSLIPVGLICLTSSMFMGTHKPHIVKSKKIIEN